MEKMQQWILISKDDVHSTFRDEKRLSWRGLGRKKCEKKLEIQKQFGEKKEAYNCVNLQKKKKTCPLRGHCNKFFDDGTVHIVGLVWEWVESFTSERGEETKNGI